MALSSALDNQALNGDGTGDNLIGLFKRLTNPSAPASGIETWTRFIAVTSSGIEGLWAEQMKHVMVVACGPETYRLAASIFQGTDSEESAQSYLERVSGGFWCNSRNAEQGQ